MTLPPRWQTPPPTYENPTPVGTTLRPYLTLPYILSLTWLAYPIISLLFVAFRLQLSLASAEDAISDAKDNLLTSCKAAEHAASAAASMPRFMAIGTNKQIIDAVNGTMEGAREALILALTVMEAIINFVVDTYRSTFLCFLELAVRGGLSILIAAVSQMQSVVSAAASGIKTSIQNDISAANSAIQSAINGINKVNPFGDITAPTINVPSLDALDNIQFPSDFEDALRKLNDSLPSISDLKSKIDAIIDTPFELVKKDINDTMTGLSFNDSVLPLPEQNALSFCGQMDTGVVDDLGVELVKVARIGSILLILLAILLLAGMWGLEWYKWRSLKKSLQRTRMAWATDPTIYRVTAVSSVPTLEMSDHNLLTLHATSTHPLLSLLANKLSALLRLSPSQYIHLQFFFHYVFHPPALAAFLIGFFGLLSVELQLLALGPVRERFSKEVAASVADFSSTISASINQSMQNQSSVYANSVNGQVLIVQNGVNDGMFGWVNATTTTLNDTINAFYTDIQDTVSAVFGGTILDAPTQDFIRCLIGTKVEAVEKALTFLHDNLHVNLPTVDQNVLLLSPDHVNEITTPISQAAVGGGADNSEGLVGRLVNRYISALKKERIMFGIFMGIWGLVVLIAIGIILWHSYGKGFMESRKRKKWQNEQRKHVDTIVRPWYPENVEGEAMAVREKEIARSFTPTMQDEPQRGGFFAALRRSARNGGDSAERGPVERPNKLMAIGRKAFGREVLVRDEDKEAQQFRSLNPNNNRTENFEVEVRAEDGKPWWRRLMQRRGSDESFSSEEGKILSPQPSRPQRHYPNPSLTIETNILLPASQRQKLPVVVQDEVSPLQDKPQQSLGSRFSVSPAVPKGVPWTKALPENSLPTRPNRPRVKINMPQSVDSTYGPSVVPNNAPSKAPATNPFNNVPIHHGFIRPIPANTPSTPSPPTSPFGPTAALAPPPFLAGHHAKASSQNPFATCFDDDYAVDANQRPQGQSALSARPVSNPFVDFVGGTPRAV